MRTYPRYPRLVDMIHASRILSPALVASSLVLGVLLGIIAAQYIWVPIDGWWKYPFTVPVSQHYDLVLTSWHLGGEAGLSLSVDQYHRGGFPVFSRHLVAFSLPARPFYFLLHGAMIMIASVGSMTGLIVGRIMLPWRNAR